MQLLIVLSILMPVQIARNRMGTARRRRKEGARARLGKLRSESEKVADGLKKGLLLNGIGTGKEGTARLFLLFLFLLAKTTREPHLKGTHHPFSIHFQSRSSATLAPLLKCHLFRSFSSSLREEEDSLRESGRREGILFEGGEEESFPHQLSARRDTAEEKEGKREQWWGCWRDFIADDSVPPLLSARQRRLARVRRRRLRHKFRWSEVAELKKGLDVGRKTREARHIEFPRAGSSRSSEMAGATGKEPAATATATSASLWYE
jgi:hypothetical protein